MTIKNYDNKDKEYNELEDFAKKNTILQVVAGSNAYGTNLPSSDWDERAIFLDSFERVCTPFEKIETIKYAENDVVAYEFSKYMSLLMEQNPNILELIWTDPKDITYKNSLGDFLIDNRSKFLTREVKNSYVGYAQSQLKRIKGHNKWINNVQPVEEPEPKDFITVIINNTNNKEMNKKIPHEGFFAVALGDNNYALFENKNGEIVKNLSWIDKRGNIIADKKNKLSEIREKQELKAIVKFNKQSFEDVHTNWKSYWSWKNNRNEKRSELEEKYGYDTKHAMHLIRLLKTGLEILEDNVVNVKRHDYKFLLDIRSGVFSYDEIIKLSDDLTQKIDIVAKKSKLPESLNKYEMMNFMANMYKSHWDNSLNNTLIIKKI